MFGIYLTTQLRKRRSAHIRGHSEQGDREYQRANVYLMFSLGNDIKSTVARNQRESEKATIFKIKLCPVSIVQHDTIENRFKIFLQYRNIHERSDII